MIGVVLVLGFLLLLVALQAPLIAALGVLTNLLATGAAFGVARLIFQDGHLSGLLGFESQGFLDAWGPVFFFAMIFAISMDYTVFLLSSAKEHWDRSHDPKEAMVGGLAHSGRVILAAARRDGRGVLHLRPLRPAAARRRWASSSASPSCSTRCWSACCWCRSRCGWPAAGPGGARRGSTGCCPTSGSATDGADHDDDDGGPDERRRHRRDSGLGWTSGTTRPTPTGRSPP